MARFTILFERLAVDVLKECDVTGAVRLLRTGWDETWYLMQGPVSRGLKLKEPVAPVHIGVDEKSAGRGQNCATIVRALDRATVVYIADERRQASLEDYIERFSSQKLGGVEAGAMDMWEPFANSARAHL
jgi:transposase